MLELIYLKELKLIEIAHILKSTPQNVSNLHRKALKTLLKEMG
ncbi:sigma-70 family RNA polymerase sigma factor [Lederbergia lenta]